MIADTADEAVWYLEAGFTIIGGEPDDAPSWFRLAMDEQMKAAFTEDGLCPAALWVDRRGQKGWKHVRCTIAEAMTWIGQYYQRDFPVEVFHTTLRLVHCETGEIIPEALWNP